MNRWDAHVLPRLIERSLGAAQVQPFRAEVCAGLSGRVLEIGFGSGLNVPHYPPAVTGVTAVEPNDTAWRLARRRVALSAVPVVRRGLDGQRLDEPDASYDTLLSTFTLCTIPDPAAALAEVRRVLRPGSTLHLLEHGLSPDVRVARWQRRLTPLQRRVAGGCHLDREPLALVEAAGFEPLDVVTGYVPGPAPSRAWGHVVRVTAVRR